MEELLAKYFSEEADKDERSLVESWRSQSKENAESFFEAKLLWLESSEPVAPNAGILASILESDSEKKGLQFLLLNYNWPKYAAAAVLVLALGLLFVLNQESSTFSTTTLADGSEIALHGDAQLEIVAVNDHIREVKLVSGKAYFDIERDESRPFIIRTENATVKVLGTSFLVEAETTGTEVCVESGMVELRKADDESLAVNLEKGDMGHVSIGNKGIIKKPNENLNYLAWKTKVLTFKNSEMSEVKKVLEEVYGIEVILENANLSNCKLTAKINKKKAKDAIEIIARTFNISYDMKDRVVTLSGAGC